MTEIEEENTDNFVTVSELTELIKNVLKVNFDKTLHVIGEVSNYKLSKNNIFFTLKDEDADFDYLKVLPNNHLLTMSSNGNIRIWDPETNKCISKWENYYGKNKNICVAIWKGKVVIADHELVMFWE